MEINIQNVSMTYPNGKQALKDLTLDLRTPSLIGLLGPNGAGKSTLMKLLVTALLPTSGTIQVDGRSLTKSERALFLSSKIVTLLSKIFLKNSAFIPRSA